MGADEVAFLRHVAERNSARRVGMPDYVVRAVLFALIGPYVTGPVVHVDGGWAPRPTRGEPPAGGPRRAAPPGVPLWQDRVG
ncbi:hypothetical protein B4N89_44360 [Embleya scabrispora]|uniref:Short-chain dehydrogenase n=1 Tax=Embleya scabrispora TaxID=159449 RepID=A0A1T3NL18_9ACTN|nr:hypothetical protein [Embleya scabrispora]OPC77527.1 hypothetical protein B4N89_44360 [Embleya scabrispora]